jgi:tetratricopeptide (TPR) repeat protein
MKGAALPVLLAALAQTAPPAPEASLADRLGWNARERTAAGRSALEKGEGDRAVPAFDTALRLQPASPLARFNAGTAHLAAQDSGALPLLEEAAKSAPADLAPSAWYNLGNGRLAAHDARGAIAAYVEALRRQPDHQNAKVNLELALRELQKQQDSSGGGKPKPGQPPGTGEKPLPDEEKKSSGGAENEPQQQPREQAPQEPPQPAPGGERDSPQPKGPGQERRELPQFRDLPDMTAEQAAAILRAVENLERQQRRDRAAKEAAARAQVEIDW